MRLSSALATTLAAAGLASVAVPMASAATPQNYYGHGSYAQSVAPTKAACDTMRGNVVKALETNRTVAAYKVADIKAGVCHKIDAYEDGKQKSGYIYTVTYKANKPLWASDANYGTSLSAGEGAHSFKAIGTAKTLAAAQDQQVIMIRGASAANGGLGITSRSAITKDASGVYTFSLTYDSRAARSSNDIELSEKRGVKNYLAAPAVKTPPPVVKPVPDASNVGINKPGDATMGWNDGSKDAPVATPPSGPLTTETKTGNTTTKTTTNPTTGVVTKTTTTAPVKETIGVEGIDISNWTKVNDWAGWKASGVKWAYIKATEGTYYKSASFNKQYAGATDNGIIRGAYHFAIPSATPGAGAKQADFAIANGGGWSPDGRTLPVALDMEWNPYSGGACYGMSQSQMNTFARDFINRYKARTGVTPVIYTASSWWNQCVGGSYKYNDVPLWMARWASTPGAVPTSWAGSPHSFWQYADLSKTKGIDANVWNGTLTNLRRFATAS